MKKRATCRSTRCLSAAAITDRSRGAVPTGVDFLDFNFRLEKLFDIKLTSDIWAEWFPSPRTDISAGEVHESICKVLTAQGKTILPSSWHRVKLCVARTAGKSPLLVHPQSLLRADLGFE